MQRATLTISTESRNYTVQGTVQDIDLLFDRLVKHTFKPIPEGACGSEYTDCTAPDSCEDTGDFEDCPVEPEVPFEVGNSPACDDKEVSDEPAKEETNEEASNKEVVKSPKKSRVKKAEEPADSVPKKYRGFLLIKCEHCGEVRGFNSRYDISSYKCDCGGETHLENLVPLTALCECGKRWRYLTNITDDSYELNCIHCGSPIPVFYNERKNKYETIVEYLPPKKGSKGGKK